MRQRGPVQVFARGEEPGDDLSLLTTPEERIAMVWELTARMWELSGLPVPTYKRSEIPGRIIRR